LFTVLGGKFKFSAQDSDLEYLFWQRKISPVSSDLKPPLSEVFVCTKYERKYFLVSALNVDSYWLGSSPTQGNIFSLQFSLLKCLVIYLIQIGK
jgi:hypothetical protein